MANGHAELSPSSAERWMTCPGSVILSEGLPDSSSEYADEGTAAHFLAQHCLETGDHPASYIGREIAVDEGDVWFFDCGSRETSFLLKADADFAASVNSYVQYVRSVVEATGGTLLVEQRLDISFLTLEEDAAGTSDAVILAGDELIVVDLKFGRGVEVEAEENKQLMIYALAALREFEMLGDFEKVRLVICQPRINHTAEWDVPVSVLRDFQVEVTKAAKRVWAAKMIADDVRKDQSSRPDLFHPTEKGCRWCRAGKRNLCHALDAKVEAEVGADFEDMTQRGSIPVLQGSGRFEDDDQELSVKMQACDLIEQWISAVRAEVERRLLRGVPVPGYKLVQGKKGNRQWDDAATAELTLKGMKIKVEDMYDMKVISPTTAEKLFKAGIIGPRQWPKVEAMIVQKDGKPSVAPESDKRPALVVDKPEDDFEDLTGGLPDLI